MLYRLFAAFASHTFLSPVKRVIVGRSQIDAKRKQPAEIYSFLLLFYFFVYVHECRVNVEARGQPQMSFLRGHPYCFLTLSL